MQGVSVSEVTPWLSQGVSSENEVAPSLLEGVSSEIAVIHKPREEIAFRAL
ncbi:MAG TPA: hypothetical protein VJ043_00380 [Candidatus Paceibacterota bacterium]|nr:hypothetical protein [Candidatus Paceibacterota bacterium]